MSDEQEGVPLGGLCVESDNSWQQEHESSIWREFACAACAIGDWRGPVEKIAMGCANFADAMMKEARERGKL